MGFRCLALARLLGVAVCAALVSCGGGAPEAPAAGTAALKATVADFQGNGYWWNPAASGTGFFFEAQGGVGVVTYYMYEASGRPVWYAATGPLRVTASGSFEFAGDLMRYSGGQPGYAAAYRAPVASKVGETSITFRANGASVSVGGQSYEAQRFFAPSAAAPLRHRAETGIYWNPAESGRGFTMETFGITTFVGVFHYNAGGEPTWNLVSAGSYDATGYAEGTLEKYTGGQTLGGTPRPAVRESVNVDRFGVTFLQSCAGEIFYPEWTRVPVRRFAFGSLPAGEECRTPRALLARQDVPLVLGTARHAVAITKLAPARIQGTMAAGGKVAGQVSFQLAGDLDTLANRVLYVVLQDPDGLFYPTGSAYSPAIAFNAPTRTGAAFLNAAPLTATGRYRGTVRAYVCIDEACKTQLVGSPLEIPYDFEIVPGVAIEPAANAVVPIPTGTLNHTAGVGLAVTIPANARSAYASVPGFAQGSPTIRQLTFTPSDQPQKVGLSVDVYSSWAFFSVPEVIVTATMPVTGTGLDGSQSSQTTRMRAMYTNRDGTRSQIYPTAPP